MELFGEDSGVMTDGTQPPRGLVGVWELPEGGGEVGTACFQGLWPVVAMGSPTACESNLERL